MSKNLLKMREDAKSIFFSGLQSVNPEKAVYRYCKVKDNIFYAGNWSFNLSDFKNIYVIGFGKAAAPMSESIEKLLSTRITDGNIIVKYGHRTKLNYVNIIEAGHPVPDKNGIHGAKQILELAQKAGKKDLVLCLVSGGGSALLPFPANGISLKDKQQTIQTLLSCGATIHEINTIRKHISGIKGGLLAKTAWPALIVSLILSDVIGDDLDVIASGPCVPDPTTFKDCMDIISKYNIAAKLPESVIYRISSGHSGDIPETPKPNDPVFNTVRNLVIGSNVNAILSAKQKAEALGYHTIILSSMIKGDTSQAAYFHTAIAREVIKTGNPVPVPACILSGGETTVVLKGDGLGGRNQEFTLISGMEIAGLDNMVVLSGGTDGTDGPTDAAGAVADGYTTKRAYELGLDPSAFLKNNDSYHFFKLLGDLLITGPTNTNVMDLRIILVK